MPASGAGCGGLRWGGATSKTALYRAMWCSTRPAVLMEGGVFSALVSLLVIVTRQKYCHVGADSMEGRVGCVPLSVVCCIVCVSSDALQAVLSKLYS